MISRIDETSIVLKRKNDYAWSKIGTKCTFSESAHFEFVLTNSKCTIVEPNNYELRYSMCMAINKDRIISYRLISRR